MTTLAHNLFLVNCDNIQEWESSVGMFDEESVERLPFIAVMALKAPSQAIQMLTSPSLVCTATAPLTGREAEGGGGGAGENNVIGLPASSMTHHENKSAGGLNYHIHLSSAFSDVVLEKDPNQPQAWG